MPSRLPLPTARNRGTALSVAPSSTGISYGIGGQVLRVVPKHQVAIGVGEPDRSRTPTTIAFAVPDGNASSTDSVAGSTITTCVPPGPPNPFVIQTAPSPAATPVGMPSVDFAGVTSPVSGSIRFTVSLPG